MSGTRTVVAKVVAAATTLTALNAALAAEQPLFVSKRITDPATDVFTPGIEGPTVDAAGNLYVVSFRNRESIGRLKPGAAHFDLFITLQPTGEPPGSRASGLRVDREGRIYVANFNKKRVLVIDPVQAGQPSVAKVYFASSQFHQPNDLALATDGTLYASDPLFSAGTGQVWRIARNADGTVSGQIMTHQRPGGKMGVTNGIDLSPDGKTLYVSESPTREIWSYRIDGTNLADAQQLMKFTGPTGPELDGLRTDVDGKIYVARNGSKSIAVIDPATKTVVRTIPTVGKNPSNLSFGGPDGKTVFVTQVDGQFIESFRVDRPGREPCAIGAAAAC